MELGKKDYIKRYYSDMGCDAIFSSNIITIMFAFVRGRKDCVVVSDNRISRGCAKLFGIRRITEEKASELAFQYSAMKDALLLLAKKNVPVYFYNRVGMEKENFDYSDSAVRRMKNDLSFPVMYDDIEKYEVDLKELFGERYSREYVEEIGKIPQVVRKGDEYCHEDYSSNLLNVTNGKRRTCYQPEVYTKVIHVYGRCGVFGYAVEDADTFPSRLQKELNDRGYRDIRVVNHGLWGGVRMNMWIIIFYMTQLP